MKEEDDQINGVGRTVGAGVGLSVGGATNAWSQFTVTTADIVGFTPFNDDVWEHKLSTSPPSEIGLDFLSDLSILNKDNTVKKGGRSG